MYLKLGTKDVVLVIMSLLGSVSVFSFVSVRCQTLSGSGVRRRQFCLLDDDVFCAFTSESVGPP